MSPHLESAGQGGGGLWGALHRAIRAENNDRIVELVLQILPLLYRPTDNNGNDVSLLKVPVTGPIGALLGTVLPSITTHEELCAQAERLPGLHHVMRDRLTALYPRITDQYLGRLLDECGRIEYRATTLMTRLWTPGKSHLIPAVRFLSYLGKMRAAEAFAGTDATTPDPYAAVVVASAWRRLHDAQRAVEITTVLINGSHNLAAALTTRAGAFADLREFSRAHADARRSWGLVQNAYIANALIRTSEAVGDERAHAEAIAYLQHPHTTIPYDFTF